jgi:WD40 repeat protein
VVDDTDELAVAAGAPVFAVAERTKRPEPAEPRRSRRVELIDGRTYAVSRTVFVDPGELAQFVLSPRGTALAWSIEGDHVVHLQHLGSHAWLDLSANSASVAAVAISPDDTRLAVANRHVTDNITVGTVGATTAQSFTTARGVTQLLFSHDGARLFVVDFDGKLHVVDASTGRGLGTFDPKAGASGALVESPDGRHLVYARHAVVVLDARTGAEVSRVAVTAQVEALALAPDGDGIAIGDAQGDVRLLPWPPAVSR